MATSLVSTGVQFPDATIQTTAASGNQISLTASGSIALGKAVLQQSDNSVIQMTGTNASIGSAQFVGGSTTVDGSGYSVLPPISAVNNTGTTIVTASPVGGNTTNIQVRAGTISGTTITWGTASVITLTSTPAQVGLAITYDVVNAKWVLWYNTAAPQTIAARTVSVTGTTITLGTAVNLSTLATGFGTLQATYDANAGKHMVIYQAVTTGYPTVNVLTVSGTTVSYGTAVTLESVSTGASIYVALKIVYDSLSLKNFVCWRNNTTNTLKINMATVSGTTATIGTTLDTTIAATVLADPLYANKYTQIFVDSTRARYVILAPSITSSPATNLAVITGFVAKEYTLSGSNLSFSNNLNFSNINLIDSNGVPYTPVTIVTDALYDSNNQVLTLAVTFGTSAYEAYFCNYKFLSTSTNLYQMIASKPISGYLPWASVVKVSATSYVGTVSSYVFSDGSGTNLPTTSDYVLTPATSNRNLGALYGVSNGTYTNGQTANIVYGGAGYYVNGLSGLTRNTRYFVDVSNTLTTSVTDATPNGLVLNSLSTTQLQVV